jgi:hypothetical protein
MYVKLTSARSNDLRVAFEGTAGKYNKTNRYGRILSSPDTVSAFFATITHAEDYNLAEVLELRHIISPDELQKVENVTFTALDVEPLLRRICNTAPRCKNVPT